MIMQVKFFIKVSIPLMFFGNYIYMDSRLRGNDRLEMLDCSISRNPTSFFVIVGLDPTIQKNSKRNHIIRFEVIN
jgi:hypothetical protein